jgi:hypothetical protein
MYTVTAQRIFVQQQTLTFYMQVHFLFVGEYFSHNNFLQTARQKMADCLKTLAFLSSQIFTQLAVNVLRPR